MSKTPATERPGADEAHAETDQKPMTVAEALEVLEKDALRTADHGEAQTVKAAFIVGRYCLQLLDQLNGSLERASTAMEINNVQLQNLEMRMRDK